MFKITSNFVYFFHKKLIKFSANCSLESCSCNGDSLNDLDTYMILIGFIPIPSMGIYVTFNHLSIQTLVEYFTPTLTTIFTYTNLFQ